MSEPSNSQILVAARTFLDAMRQEVVKIHGTKLRATTLPQRMNERRAQIQLTGVHRSTRSHDAAAGAARAARNST